MYIKIKDVKLWSEDYFKIMDLLEQNGYSTKNENAYNDIVIDNLREEIILSEKNYYTAVEGEK